jgi:hypothetical protein
MIIYYFYFEKYINKSFSILYTDKTHHIVLWKRGVNK